MTAKQLGLVAITCMMGIGLVSCDASADEKIDRDLTNLGNYMDSIKATSTDYTAEKWENIKTEYNETIREIDVEKTKLSASASTKLENVKAEYNKLKDEFEAKIKARKADDYKVKVRRALFIDNEVGDDRKFDFVTGKNALAVYENFVNTVKKNRDTYTREDWDEIKSLYEALDNRKNEIEKDLPTADNLKIAKLKVQFAAIKSVERPAAKVEENTDSKK
ncbi:MAG: hypothetical protein EOO01_28300 [Chitinophagaceae bacterium]|nr:MAG: hypothetical protein EOO01_28300 [Chitinophagaceae bacterium]